MSSLLAAVSVETAILVPEFRAILLATYLLAPVRPFYVVSTYFCTLEVVTGHYIQRVTRALTMFQLQTSGIIIHEVLCLARRQASDVLSAIFPHVAGQVGFLTV